MSKANKLTIIKQQQIATYKHKNPKISMSAIAEQFNVTVDQVNYAVQKSKKGELKLGRIRTKKINLDEIKSDENLLKVNYEKALKHLNSVDNIAVDDRINLLDKLANTSKTIQQMELQNHLKRLDANVIASIIRRFRPDATDDDIIKIYSEELEKNRK